MWHMADDRWVVTRGPRFVALNVLLIVLATAHALVVLLGPTDPARLLADVALRGSLRTAALRSTVLVAVAVALGLGLAIWAARRRGVAATTVVAIALPLAGIGLVPYVLDPAAWRTAPVLFIALTTAFVGWCAVAARLPPGLVRLGQRLAPTAARIAPAVVALAIALWVGFVAVHTIWNHRSLGTSAYDLGIQENVVWNTLHGHFFESSIMAEGHYLGVHASLVLLLAVPFYALAQRSESLLVLQALLLGVAAWPLFLTGRRLLGGTAAGVVVAALWLLHPGVHGAAFYDFHALAFAPLFLFAAAWALTSERPLAAAVAVVLLLTVKEDMSLVVALLGIAVLLAGRWRQGSLLVAAGVVAYLVLQHGVIPHFAGGHHSYTWYYTDLIPRGAGPAALVATAAIDPVYVLRYALSADRVLYLLQLLAPFAFVPLLGLEGWVLTSYGLATSLLASRPPLHQLGFQYALLTAAPAAVAFVLVAARLAPQRCRRVLVAALVLAAVACWQYGMFGPRVEFRGGFKTVDFAYDQTDRERYREVRELAGLIPADASVTASEALVPHVAARRWVETIRFAAGRPGRRYDYFFILRNAERRELARMPEVSGQVDYELVRGGRWCSLLRRKAVDNPVPDLDRPANGRG